MNVTKRARTCRGLAILMTMLLLTALLPLSASAAETVSQHERVRVGFFAMDGYHMMDEDGNRSGYGYDFLRLMARYWDVDYEYVGYDKSWDEMQRMLIDGEIDMVTSARRTPEREELFDFSRPIGTNNGILTVRSDNSTIVEGKYSTYDGMRVALLRGNSRNDEFAEYARTKGFTYKSVYFDSAEEIAEALQNGTVDAIVTSSLRKMNNERILEKFGSSDFYVIVKKGNTELLNKINYATDQMNAAEGSWKTTLYNKNYETTDTKNLEYTEEEKRIIAQYSKENPLHVLCDPTRYPYSYTENGEVKGILPDYFRKIADYAGLSYEFLVPATRDEYIAYQSNKDAVNISIDARLDTDNYAETKEWGLTAPYITMRMARVTRRDFDGKINVVTTVNQTASTSIEDVLAPGAEKLMCSTRQEMMEAVRDGKADAAFVYYYMAQAFINSDTTGTMTYTLLEQPTFSYRMVVSSTENHALAGILTKAMYAMPDNLVEDLATQYTTYKATNLTLVDMICLHPVTAVAIIVFISWMAVTLIVILNRLQTRRKLQLAAQQKAKEMTVLAEQAQAASKAKSTFLSNMTHDIRTPMNAIIGFTNIALHQDSVPEMHNCLKKIKESSDHLLSLLNDVLDLSRIESGKVEFSPVPTNITAVTDSVIEIVKGMLLNRELNFEVHREPLQNPYVMTEPVRIREILVNILNNAVKFTKDGGTIRFDAGGRPGVDAQHIVICYRIKDTGIGMSEDFQKKIFDEFAQEENGVRTQYKGTGLGMPISKKYIELMGGTITVDSRKGVGTTFTVEIPMELTNAEKVEKTKPLVQHNDLKGIKVLLAEDNDLNAELATMLLEDLGMTVTRAADGQEVVDLFAEYPAGTYDIILMDIMMPKMDGHQAAKAIRAMYADRPDAEEIPIIALSANAFSEDVQASQDAGMNGHVSKPLNMEGVTKVIERNLNRP
jgi:signal transduction histidine kinase